MEAAASEDLLEQKVHELDARLRQMKEERDQVVADNDDLQEQLDMTNTMRDVGMQKIGELKIEVQKLAEEITRIDYSCTTQEHELKTLSDHMCDLNSLKETVKDHNDEIAIIKEDYTRMKSHLNVSAKLELQTQERMYESRLLHLENVLTEMRQQEVRFAHLAEETATLKDQVDALRELSISVQKDESYMQRYSCGTTLPPSAYVMESPIRSQSNFSFKSEENNLEKEMLQQSHVMSMQQEIEKEEEDSTTSTNDPQKNKEMEELHVEEATKDKFNNDDSYAHCDSFGANETNDFYEDDDAESIGSSKSKDQLMNVVTTSSPKSGVKITGTIKMMKPLEVQPSKSFLKTIYKDLEDQDTEYSDKGCMHSAQRWAVTIWSTLFD